MTWSVNISALNEATNPDNVENQAPQQIEKLKKNNFNIIDSVKYGDKYYVAVMHPRVDTGGNVCIFSSSNSDIFDSLNWSQQAVHSFSLKNSFDKSVDGQTLKIISGSNELLLFYSQKELSKPFWVVTSSNGSDWSESYSIGQTAFSTYTGPEDGIGNDFDVIYEKDKNRYLVAFACNKDNEFVDTQYGYGIYGTIGSGSIYIATANVSNVTQQWIFGKKLELPQESLIEDIFPEVSVTERLSGLYGNSISLIKDSNGTYTVYSSLPVNYIKVNGTPLYLESIWRHQSFDGINWNSAKTACLSNEADYDPNFSIDDLLNIARQHSFIGFSGIKAVEMDRRIFLFYTQPGSNNYKGCAFVSYGEKSNNTFSVGHVINTTNKIRILEGLQQSELFGSTFDLFQSNFRTFSVDAITLPDGIHYSFGSPRHFDYRGAFYLGHSIDGINFEQAEQINIEQGDLDLHPALGTSVCFAEKDGQAVSIYSDFSDIHIQTKGSKIIWALDVESEKAKRSYKHAILEPFFAPGILYNTIKSGIAVDWPAMTGSFPFEIVSLQPLQYSNIFLPKTTILKSYSTENGAYTARGSIRSRIDYRIPFENIMKPEEVFVPKDEITENAYFSVSLGNLSTAINSLQDRENIINKYLDKSYIYSGHETFINPLEVSSIYDSSPKRFGVPFVYKINKGNASDSLFSKAMNNYLAEIPSFFLRDEKMGSLQSEPDYTWSPLVEGCEYYVDLVLEKNKDLVMIEGFYGQNHPTGSGGQRMDGRYFGYPLNTYTASLENLNDSQREILHNDPAYSAYTPPYFENTSRMRLKFVPPSGTRKYTLEEIFANITVEDIVSDIDMGWQKGSDAEKNNMKLGASIQIFDRKSAFTIELQSFGDFDDTDSTTLNEQKDSKVWVIRPKMETPVLDFSSQQKKSYSSNYIKDAGFGRGMWSGYGTIPEKGIQLRLEYPFSNTKKELYDYGSYDNGKEYSLLDYVKFKNTSLDLGVISDEKTISEAIVLIPYVDRKDMIYKYGTKQQYVDGAHFIKINKNIYDKQHKNIKANKNAVTIDDGSEVEIVETSISRMIKTANKYVLPPNLNFFKYPDIEPFVMYFMEFSHTLSKEDLKNIWQSQMPDISYSHEVDEVEITHEFTKFDFFNGEELPVDLKWLIFKIKKKAEISYDKMISKTKGEIKVENEEENGQYSYNWPYDFFSLVELAKVEIELEYTKGKTPPPISGYSILPK